MKVDTDRIKEKLLCGFDPDKLDPSIDAAIGMVSKLLAAVSSKDPQSMQGMSMMDLSKALVNAAKALDGLARLRSFSTGGPDSRPEGEGFLLKVIAPDEKDESEAPDSTPDEASPPEDSVQQKG